jgi:phosphodiesterase/alkaline phosphatase D-like protein
MLNRIQILISQIQLHSIEYNMLIILQIILVVKRDNLKPNNQYYYQVWFSYPENKSNIVSQPSIKRLFRTAPDSTHQKNIISFVVGGDLGVQKYCERFGLEYPIFSVIRDLSPDFFIFNGDQSYADGDCSTKGPINVTGWHNIPGNFSGVSAKDVNWTDSNQVRDIFNKHWEYVRSDKSLQSLSSNTSLYSQADDHDVINNYGKWSHWSDLTKNRTGFINLVNSGTNIF